MEKELVGRGLPEEEKTDQRERKTDTHIHKNTFNYRNRHTDKLRVG